MSEPMDDNEAIRLTELMGKLPIVSRDGADYTAGYLVGYRIGMQNAFVVACLHNDSEAVELIRDEYTSRIGTVHVALMEMGQANEVDKALIRKHAAELGALAGARMWELDIVEGAYIQVQSAVIEGHEDGGDSRDSWDPIGGDAA